MWWPGAYVFYHGDKTFHIYCGDGLKMDAKTYFPVEPPMMMSDRAETVCFREPNPTQEQLERKARE
jgi:hypothetical protein